MTSANRFVRAAARLRNVALKQARHLAMRSHRYAKVLLDGTRGLVGWLARLPRRFEKGGVSRGKRVFKGVRRPIRRLAGRTAQMQDQLSWSRTEWRIEREIEQALGGDGPVLIGPWLSEVGYEVLYWIPFLHWVLEAFEIDPQRAIAISRGGVASWYDGIAARYVEILDHVNPVDFVRKNNERGATKQHERSPLDDEILTAARRTLGLADARVLHPSLMYRLFGFFWSGHRSMSFVDAHTRFVPHRAPAVIEAGVLPTDYVAVKFYAARALPDTSEIRRALQWLIAGLAEQTTVVLLDTGLTLDDHSDYVFAGAHRVLSVRGLMRPQNNLAVQTQVIAGARAFVGTCGSVAWLAPMLGIDTAAALVDPRWLHAHLAVAFRAYHRMNAAVFAPLDLRALDPLRLAPALRSRVSADVSITS